MTIPRATRAPLPARSAARALLAALLAALASGAPVAHPPVPPADAGSGPLWRNGPPDDPAYFPIGVWLQDPAQAPAYRAIGINLFVGQWQGPTESQVDALRAAGMPTIADQTEAALAHPGQGIVLGWLQPDEPDNAQPDGAGGYGPCVDPSTVVQRYERLRARDPTRPVLLNLGQGVAHDYDRPYVGRGSACSRNWDQYPQYVRGADIVSFDIYPVTSPYDHIRGQLWRVALGLDRLREWTGGLKPIWSVIETTHIHADVRPTPDQIRTQVWMSLVHGSRGIVYFAHEWVPRFREAALLHYPETRDAVGELNRQIATLARVLNAATTGETVAVLTSPDVPVDALVRRHDGWLYVFAVAMRPEPTRATFLLPRSGAAGPVEVLGEQRQLALSGAAFADDFAGYGVHLYRLRWPSALDLPWLGR